MIKPIVFISLFLIPALLTAAPPSTNPTDAPGPSIERVEFHDAALQDAARLLSDQTGLNIVCSAEAGKTKVSLFLQNVPVRVAVEELARRTTFPIASTSPAGSSASPRSKNFSAT